MTTRHCICPCSWKVIGFVTLMINDVMTNGTKDMNLSSNLLYGTGSCTPICMDVAQLLHRGTTNIFTRARKCTVACLHGYERAYQVDYDTLMCPETRSIWEFKQPAFWPLAFEFGLVKIIGFDRPMKYSGQFRWLCFVSLQLLVIVHQKRFVHTKHFRLK